MGIREGKSELHLVLQGRGLSDVHWAGRDWGEDVSLFDAACGWGLRA